MGLVNKLFDNWVATTLILKITFWIILVVVVFSFADEVAFDGELYGWTKLHTVLYYGPHFLLGMIIYLYHLASKRAREKAKSEE